MITQEKTSLVHHLESRLRLEGPLRAVRQTAWDLFVQEGDAHLPSPVKEALLSSRHTALLEEDIFTLNRSHFADLPQECVALPLSEAQRAYGSFFQSKWAQVRRKRDPLSLLNLALHGEGVWIYIPSGVKVDKPLKIEIALGNNKHTPFSRIHLYLGAHAELTLKLEGGSGQLFFEADCDQGAQLRVESTGAGCDALRFNLKRSSSVDMVSCVEEIPFHWQDISCALVEEEAKAHCTSLTVLGSKAQGHTRIKMDHRAPRCLSTQHYRAVLSDGSRSNFAGEIAVQKGAVGTDAAQQSRVLILGAGAVAKSTPILSIHADDVKASHGATVAQLSSSEMFYLRSRGFSFKEAKKTLVNAFCKEITDRVGV